MEASTENKNNVTCLQEKETFQKPAKTSQEVFVFLSAFPHLEMINTEYQYTSTRFVNSSDSLKERKRLTCTKLQQSPSFSCVFHTARPDAVWWRHNNTVDS